MPVIITHTSLPLKYVEWLTYESLCCLRGVNDKGNKKARAPTVPMLCIPADTWHKAFDSSLHTLIKMTGGDEEKEDDKRPSRERMSQQMTVTCAQLCWCEIRLFFAGCILKSVFAMCPSEAEVIWFLQVDQNQLRSSPSLSQCASPGNYLASEKGHPLTCKARIK